MNLWEAASALVMFLWLASWQACLTLTCAFVLVPFLRTAHHRATMLHLALIGCGLVPLLSLVLPHFILFPDPLPIWLPLVDVPVATVAAFRPAVGFAGGVAAVWLTGFVVGVVRIVMGWACVHRLLSLTQVVDAPRIQKVLLKIGGRQPVQLRTLAGLTAPFCWQIQRPLIVLPESLLDRSDDDLELLLRHEMAHLKAGDPVRLFLEQCLLAVFWFHPLLWRGARQAHLWREIACDEWAVAAENSPRRMARLLTELAEIASVPRLVDLRLSWQGAPHDLQTRLLRLVRMSAGRASHPRRWPAAFTALAFCMVLLATVRLGGPWSQQPTQRWFYWPPLSGQLLDLVGIQVVDFDLQRAARDPRERTPEHRAKHRKWRAD